ncbi:MAG: MlaD family protein [Treponema sp.]|nr:MlaD family protein [Treponema sp.]
MKFSIRHADKIVGFLVILALAILVFVIFMLGRNQRWFVQDFEYNTYLDSATGVSPNMAISYKGFTIGHVKRIGLTDDNLVEVFFTIFQEYTHRVTDGSLVEIASSPIPGLGGGINFHPGKQTTQIPNGGFIPEINSAEARELRRRGWTDVSVSSDSLVNIINQVSSLLENLNMAIEGSDGYQELVLGQIIADLAGTIYNINSLTGTLPGQIMNIISPIPDQLFGVVDSLTEQLNPSLNNLARLTEQVIDIADSVTEIAQQAADPSGVIMSFMDGEGPIYDSIVSAVSSLSGIVSSLEKTAEFIPMQLPQLSVIIGEINTVIRSVQDILISVANNPLLRGGIPERVETGPGGASPRNLGF